MFKRITISILFSAFIFNASKNYAQTQTLGLFLNDTLNTFKGYTVFAPKHNSMTYLIDNEGRKVHEWSASTLPPGQTVYLLENGDLLRSCMVHGQLSSKALVDLSATSIVNPGDNVLYAISFTSYASCENI